MKTPTLTGKRIFAVVVTAVLLSAVVYGLILTGSPSGERLRRFDERRVSDLQNIASAVEQYWFNSDKLPTNFVELRQSGSYYIPSINDPKTGAPYEYRVIDDKGYELCAIFETDTLETPPEGQPIYTEQFWLHPVGRKCFTKTLPERDANAPQVTVPAPKIIR